MRMKNRVKVIALCAAVIATSAIGIGVTSSNAAGNQANKSNTQKIGFERANQLALEAVAGHIKSVELEHDDGETYYDFEMIKDNKEYDVHIDAYNGQTLKVEMDDDRRQPMESQAQKNSDSKSTAGPATKPNEFNRPAPSSKPVTSEPISKPKRSDKQQMISVEQATQIATNHVNGKVKSVERDSEDGMRIYEVELMTSHGEVEVDIHAYTGEILKVDYDDKYDDDDNDHDDYDDDRN